MSGPIAFRQLSSLRLGSLEEAVRQWAQVRDSFEDMAGRAQRDMVGAAEGAEWRGENASVTRPFIATTSRKYRFGFEQARAIHSLLQDLWSTLRESRGALESVVAEAGGRRVRVDAEGVARTMDPPHQSLAEASGAVGGAVVGLGNYGELTPEQIDALGATENGIRRALETATEAHEVAVRALREIIATDRGSFSDTAYNDGDDPQRVQTLADAETFARLAGGEGQVTAANAAAMRDLLIEHGDDPLFAQAVIDSLGMEEFLRLSQRVDDSATRLDSADVPVGDLQNRLGTAFSTAMQPPDHLASEPHGSQAWNAWLRTGEGHRYQERLEDLREAGTRQLHWQAMPFGLPDVGDERIGYDVALDLLDRAEGDLDGHLFTDVLDGMIEQERDNPMAWAGNRYTGEEGEGGLDPRNDPVDRLLGLGAERSPDAVTAWFDPGPEGDTSRLDYFLGGDPAEGEEGGRRAVRLGDPQDFAAMFEGQFPQSPGLVAAVEVAATGVLPGDPVWPDDQHSQANRNIAEHVWNSFAADRPRVADNGGQFAPMLGHIGAEYIADLQNAVNGSSDGVAVTDPEVALDIEHSGSLLWDLGQNQEAYERLTAANVSQLFGAAEIAANGDYSDDAFRNDALESVVFRGGQVAGILSDAHATALYTDRIEADAAHNARVDEIAMWVDRGLNTAIYAGMGGPAPGTASLMDALESDVVDAVRDMYHEDNSAAAQEDSENQFGRARTRYQEIAWEAVSSAFSRAEHRPDDIEAISQSLVDRAGDGYDGGTTRNFSAP
ncbi:hypothetical protein RM780_16915 [Streptomyces sp. DSM 44917]|uniref:WXG100 family type VII secretion target n=1 Tax=Streptomyces boetiae TaxID=3075541 RepID=A0ABU2LAN2_9ACTN|nr:hypothetical protein [Streptomyces sp. DSM 44917]MDT0308628.1 hypothetical protein [Streptomyces sp. DSM 44917]